MKRIISAIVAVTMLAIGSVAISTRTAETQDFVMGLMIGGVTGAAVANNNNRDLRYYRSFKRKFHRCQSAVVDLINVIDSKRAESMVNELSRACDIDVEIKSQDTAGNTTASTTTRIDPDAGSVLLTILVVIVIGISVALFIGVFASRKRKHHY